jgi:hypothetical protein
LAPHAELLEILAGHVEQLDAADHLGSGGSDDGALDAALLQKRDHLLDRPVVDWRRQH